MDNTLTPAQASKRLGVSAKALRLYEQQGLISPRRTAAGYRMFGPADMSRAGQIVTLRALGLSLTQVASVLEGDPHSLGAALAGHEAQLEAQIRERACRLDRSRRLRAATAQGQMPADDDLAGLLEVRSDLNVTFNLPWPWGGELFVLQDVGSLNFIVGPLGSGKTRFARQLAATVPDAVFLGLDRSVEAQPDPTLDARVAAASDWLAGEGATVSTALVTLLTGLEGAGRTAVIVDMVEDGLDDVTQRALIAYLRRRAGSGATPLFLMTRSSAILDLEAAGPHDVILLCPANHSPPLRVAPYPGAPGYEALATCLATPEVRARAGKVPHCVGKSPDTSA